MKPPIPTLEAQEQALRNAVSRHDFAGASLAARTYTRLLQSRLDRLPASEAAHQLRRACALFDWARSNLHAARNGIAARLSKLQGISRYYAAPAARARSWNIEA